jgi:hypothetical protein
VFTPDALVQPVIQAVVLALGTAAALFLCSILIRWLMGVFRGSTPYQYTDADFAAQWAELESERIYGNDWGHEANHASERNLREMVIDDGKFGPGF